MSIEATGAEALPISTRNGVPPVASDPPGGIPRHPDPDTHPHPAPSEGGPKPATTDLPLNEPPLLPPRREAGRVGEPRVEVHHATAQHRTKHK